MSYLYLILSVFMNASTSVFGRLYQNRCGKYKCSSAFYNLLQLTSVCICWAILFAVNFFFNPYVLLYSVLFAVCYTMCNVGLIHALKIGPTMLSALLLNFALITTTIWGFIFWDSKITICVILGLALAVVTIYLCLYRKGREEKGVSLKWLIYALCAMLGNSGCSIVQRTQQMKFNGAYGSMLMFFATLLSGLVCMIIYLKSDKSDSIEMLRCGWWAPVVAGMCNVVLNIFVMLLALTSLSPSFIYPVLGVGALMIVTIISTIVFKERLRPLQWVGFFLGTTAIVLLSL